MENVRALVSEVRVQGAAPTPGSRGRHPASTASWARPSFTMTSGGWGFASHLLGLCHSQLCDGAWSRGGWAKGQLGQGPQLCLPHPGLRVLPLGCPLLIQKQDAAPEDLCPLS